MSVAERMLISFYSWKLRLRLRSGSVAERMMLISFYSWKLRLREVRQLPC